ncbi:MAG: type III polyketide synthase [Cyclobacteriaceae bacterium]
MSYITSIGTATPPHKFNQRQLADFMIRAMNLSSEDAEQLKKLYRASGIISRHTVLKDYGQDIDFDFFPNTKNLEPFPDTKKRLDLFRKHAVTLSAQSVTDCLDRIPDFKITEITHLIVVSCTGMFAPGLDIELVKKLKLNPTVQRTSITFMGCYAAFNALRVADAFCTQDLNAKILVVCTELCSIHFQKENTEDNKLANALFADGSASMLIESAPRKGINLKIGNLFCDLAEGSEDDMAWSIGNFGFEMKLSTYVPDVIKNGIGQLTQSLLSINKITLSDISYFAIHPGGKKILEAVEDQLGLTKNDNRFAYDIMKRCGNMSSPTVIFVLNEILASLDPKDHNKKILSFGFGPGLTLESVILTVDCIK